MLIEETQLKYDELIRNARIVEPKQKIRGMHTHHIIPRSCGGNDFVENTIICSPEIHFEAHRLLKDIYVVLSKKWISMQFTFLRMSHSKYGKENITAYEYAELQKFALQNVWNRLEVERWSKDGTVCHEKYNSIVEATEKTGINHGHIGECCRGTQRQAGGFLWKYVDVSLQIPYQGVSLEEARKNSVVKSAIFRCGKKRGKYQKRTDGSKTKQLREENDSTLGKLRDAGKRLALIIGFQFFDQKHRNIRSTARIYVSKKTYARKYDMQV